tara:strand:- start:10 stop:246 length:237 start_codon:yes stop_codon:yes gene_type:complete
MTNLETKAKIIQLGGKEWANNGLERVYITNEIFNVLLAESNMGSVNFGANNNKIFFDVNANAIMRSYKSKKPAVEIQY